MKNVLIIGVVPFLGFCARLGGESQMLVLAISADDLYYGLEFALRWASDLY